jgi:DNA-binding transcriptional ArsR family regulator
LKLKLFKANRESILGEAKINEPFHPNAYLQRIKNVRNGLRARTRILVVLEKRSSGAAGIAKGTSLSYSVVMHHLRLLKNEGTVDRKGSRPYVWVLTGLGQKRLVA